MVASYEKMKNGIMREKQIEAVPYYKYLGLIISTRMNWSIAKRTLSEQANKVLYKIMNIDKSCNGILPQAAINDTF